METIEKTATDRELKREQAIARLKFLETKGLLPEVRRDFEENGRPWLSVNIGIGGALYWIGGGQQGVVQSIVSRFEERTGALVYHVLETHSNLGHTYELLYVPDEQEEWDMDAEDLRLMAPCAYVFVEGAPEFSEFGCIGIRCAAGGIVRTF